MRRAWWCSCCCSIIGRVVVVFPTYWKHCTVKLLFRIHLFILAFCINKNGLFHLSRKLARSLLVKASWHSIASQKIWITPHEVAVATQMRSCLSTNSTFCAYPLCLTLFICASPLLECDRCARNPPMRYRVMCCTYDYFLQEHLTSGAKFLYLWPAARHTSPQ